MQLTLHRYYFAKNAPLNTRRRGETNETASETISRIEINYNCDYNCSVHDSSVKKKRNQVYALGKKRRHTMKSRNDKVIDKVEM